MSGRRVRDMSVKILCYLAEIETKHKTSGRNTGASEASSKWVGKTKNYYNGSKKWVEKHPYSITIMQKAHPAPIPLIKVKLFKIQSHFLR